MNSDQWLTVKEAADLIGVNTARVHQLIQQGRMEAVRRGKQWFVSLDSARERKAITDTWRRLMAKTRSKGQRSSDR